MKRALLAAPRLFLAACLLLAPAIARAATIVPPPSALGPSLEEAAAAAGGVMPGGDDAVLLYSGAEVRVSDDGRMSLRRRSIRMLRTDYAVGHYGDVRVAYDTTLQVLTIHEMRTLMADGRVIEAQPRAFNRVTPESVARCAHRTSAQEMVVSHLGVERGCVVVLDTTVEDRVPFRPWFEGEIAIVGDEPVRSGEILLAPPAGASMKTEVLGIDPALVRATPQAADGSRRLVYEGLPAVPSEGGGNPREQGGRLVFSTCPSWDALLAYALDRIDAAAVPDTLLRAWAERPMANERMPMDGRDALIKTAALIGRGAASADEPRLDWWRPIRPAAETMASRCGNLLDRAALALAAIRASGSDPRIVLKPALASIPAEVPCLQAMEDVWLTVDSWTLSVSESAAGPAPDTGWAAGLLERRDGAAVWVPAAPGNLRADLRLDLRQEDDGRVRGDVRLRLEGPLRRLFDPADPNGILDDLASRWLDGGKVLEARIERAAAEELLVGFSMEGRALGDSIDRRCRRWTLPSLPGLPDRILPGGADLARMERTTPLALRSTLEEHLEVRLRLASGSEILVMPDVRHEHAEGLELDLACSRRGAEIRVERSFAVRLPVIAPERYRDFRDLFARRSRPEGASIYGEWKAAQP